MKASAPGKLLLLGAYAVLGEGTALVVAVNRRAVADSSRLIPLSEASREVRAALEGAEEAEEAAPYVDVSDLYERSEAAPGAKLGLGSSAAALVATLGVRAALRGEDPSLAKTRDAIFVQAREAHARAQGGGSGVDVAASTYGGALAYTRKDGARAVTLPSDLHVVAFWSGISARTSDLVARVDALKVSNPRSHGSATGVIAEAACEVTDRTCDVARIVAAAHATERALDDLGRAADAPIVPAAFASLARTARSHAAAFLPSGAGGGDVGVWLGASAPPEDFLAQALSLGMHPLDLAIDASGVKRVPLGKD